MAADGAADALGVRYAPPDPTLPEPWKGLIDGNSGWKYYWNPETNITQYERPTALVPPVPSGPPPVALGQRAQQMYSIPEQLPPQQGTIMPQSYQGAHMGQSQGYQDPHQQPMHHMSYQPNMHQPGPPNSYWYESSAVNLVPTQGYMFTQPMHHIGYQQNIPQPRPPIVMQQLQHLQQNLPHQYHRAGFTQRDSAPHAQNAPPIRQTGQAAQYSGTPLNIQQPSLYGQLQQSGVDYQQHGPKYPNQMGQQPNAPQAGWTTGLKDNPPGRGGNPAMAPHQPNIAAIPMARTQQCMRSGGPSSHNVYGQPGGPRFQNNPMTRPNSAQVNIANADEFGGHGVDSREGAFGCPGGPCGGGMRDGVRDGGVGGKGGPRDEKERRSRGVVLQSDSESSSEDLPQEVLKVGGNMNLESETPSASSEEVLKLGGDITFESTSPSASSEEVLKVGPGMYFESSSGGSSEEVLKVRSGMFSESSTEAFESLPGSSDDDMDRCHNLVEPDIEYSDDDSELEDENLVYSGADKFGPNIRANIEELKTPPKVCELPEDALQVKYIKTKELKEKIGRILEEGISALRDTGQICFKIPRWKVRYEDKLGYYVCYKVGDGKCYNTKESARKAWVIMELLKLIHQLNSRTRSNMGRSVYYSNRDIIWESNTVYNALDDICRKFCCTRASLGVYPNSKGKVYGDLVFSYGKSSPLVNCNEAVQPIIDESQIRDMHIVSCGGMYVLVVEKETIFDKISKSDFCLNYSCILITGKGEADVSTRLFLHHLRFQRSLPVFVLADCNSSGIKIVSVYKHGSQAKSYDNRRMAIKDLKWIGFLPKDVDNYRLLNDGMELDDEDIKSCKNLMEEGAVKGEVHWVRQIKRMVRRRKKFELEALSTDTLVDLYLPKKLASKDWL